MFLAHSHITNRHSREKLGTPLRSLRLLDTARGQQVALRSLRGARGNPRKTALI